MGRYPIAVDSVVAIRKDDLLLFVEQIPLVEQLRDVQNELTGQMLLVIHIVLACPPLLVGSTLPAVEAANEGLIVQLVNAQSMTKHHYWLVRLLHVLFVFFYLCGSAFVVGEQDRLLASNRVHRQEVRMRLGVGILETLLIESLSEPMMAVEGSVKAVERLLVK